MKINEELYKKWLNEKYSVATRTQEEYDQFMQWLEYNTDIKWVSGEKPTEENYYDKYPKEICITNNHIFTGDGISYGYESDTKEQGYQIIEFKDLFTQDLRELLKVGYKVVFRDGSFLINGYDDFTIETSDLDKYLQGKHVSVRVDKIYRPKYNGIKSIGKPEWELVWERKEELYTLELPGNARNKYYGKGNNETKYDYKFHNKTEDGSPYQYKFTENEINNLPNEDFIKTLDKKLYEETK